MRRDLVTVYEVSFLYSCMCVYGCLCNYYNSTDTSGINGNGISGYKGNGTSDYKGNGTFSYKGNDASGYTTNGTYDYKGNETIIYAKVKKGNGIGCTEDKDCLQGLQCLYYKNEIHKCQCSEGRYYDPNFLCLPQKQEGELCDEHQVCLPHLKCESNHCSGVHSNKVLYTQIVLGVLAIALLSIAIACYIPTRGRRRNLRKSTFHRKKFSDSNRVRCFTPVNPNTPDFEMQSQLEEEDTQNQDPIHVLSPHHKQSINTPLKHVYKNSPPSVNVSPSSSTSDQIFNLDPDYTW